jgi:hypothetical protein
MEVMLRRLTHAGMRGDQAAIKLLLSLVDRYGGSATDSNATDAGRIARLWKVLAAALIDCGAEVGIAHHYGTFQLTDEPIDAPLLALSESLNSAGISRERFAALRPGQVWQR